MHSVMDDGVPEGRRSSEHLLKLARVFGSRADIVCRLLTLVAGDGGVLDGAQCSGVALVGRE